ncbi:MAG: SDR family NAD(P)-dependent oxidoreductase [Ferruginibacter sp.]
MSRIFITGSADGLDKMAAQLLVGEGHLVVLHARNKNRGDAALAAVPGAESAITADLSSIAETVKFAEQANKTGSFDTVIHNAGIGYREPRRTDTVDRLSRIFAPNPGIKFIKLLIVLIPLKKLFVNRYCHL